MKNSIATMMALMATSILSTEAKAFVPTAEAKQMVMACGATSFTQTSSLAATLATRQCNGQYLNGIGTSLDEAVQNLNGFMAVAEAGVGCNANTHSVFTGSYGVGVYSTFYCNGYTLTAVGGSVATSANNTLAIATEMAASGSYCSAPTQGAYYPEVYGFRFTYSCGKVGGVSWQVSGLGSTIDLANTAVVRMLKYSATNRRNCTFDRAELNGVIFKARLNCNDSTVYGYGSSVTSAVNDALSQAGA